MHTWWMEGGMIFCKLSTFGHMYTARFTTSKLSMWQNLHMYSQCHDKVPTSHSPQQELAGRNCMGTLTPMELCRNSRVHTQTSGRLLPGSYHIIN